MTEVAKEYATRDVSLAAFFRFKGHLLVAYRLKKNGGRGRVGEWVFNISDEDAKQLTVDYANSDIAEFEGIRRGMSKQKYS